MVVWPSISGDEDCRIYTIRIPFEGGTKERAGTEMLSKPLV